MAENKDQKDAETSKNLERKKVSSKVSQMTVTFYYILMGSAIALAIGGLWAILDAIQPVGKWTWFKDQNIGIQFAIGGAIAVMIFVLLILVYVFYKRGNKLIYRLLYPKLTLEKITKDNRYAQVISIGFLLSVMIVGVGIIISIIQGLATGGTSTSFSTFLLEMPNGLKIMFISGLVFVLMFLVILFIYIWENGYHFVLNKILKYNPSKDVTEFSNRQVITGIVFYFIILFSGLIIAVGIIWSIADAIAPTGKWGAFINYPFGWQFTIIGSLASLFFLLIVVGLLFFKRGRNFIKRAIFVKKTPDKDLPTGGMARFITIGILIALIIIVIGAIISVVLYLISLSQGSPNSVFEFLSSLPNGLLILFSSSSVFVGIWFIIGILSTWRNGYTWILVGIVKIRSKLETLEDNIKESSAESTKDN